MGRDVEDLRQDFADLFEAVRNVEKTLGAQTEFNAATRETTEALRDGFAALMAENEALGRCLRSLGMALKEQGVLSDTALRGALEVAVEPMDEDQVKQSRRVLGPLLAWAGIKR
jgi:hypothetical protein